MIDTTYYSMPRATGVFAAYNRSKAAKRKSKYVSVIPLRTVNRRTVRSLTGANKIYRFVRTTDGAQLTQTTLGAGARTFNQAVNATNTLTMAFCLADVPNSSEFTGLFDQYRIAKITVQLIPMCTVNQLSAPAGAGVPANNNPGIIATVIDYDDANNPTGLPYMEQYQNCRIQPVVSMRTISRTFKPHVAEAAYGGGVFASFANKTGQWLDSASTTISHYGLKAYVDAAGVAGTTSYQTWQVMCKYYLEFRNVR